MPAFLAALDASAVYLSPHNAAISDHDAISAMIARQIERLEAGGVLQHVVNSRAQVLRRGAVRFPSARPNGHRPREARAGRDRSTRRLPFREDRPDVGRLRAATVPAVRPGLTMIETTRGPAVARGATKAI